MIRGSQSADGISRRELLRGAAGLVAAGALSRRTGAAAASGRWSVLETARDNGNRVQPTAAPKRSVDGTAAIRCDPRRTAQTVVGFGGALTESAAYALDKLPAPQRSAVLHAYYDPVSGIGYSLARTPMTSCDFSLSSWSLADRSDDRELRDFSLSPMREHQLPLIRDVRSIAGAARFRLLASPWSPPAWMKVNGEMPHGGSLRADCAAAWAGYYVRFVEAMRAERLPVWALTVQNEPDASQPWESCRYSPLEEAAFVADHLGPALASAKLHEVRLFGWDHNRDRLFDRAEALLGNPRSAKYLAGLALHWYGAELFGESRRVLERFPRAQILFTEGCAEGGPHAGEWEPAERYARNLIGDFGNGVCGFIDWNIALDTSGGPNHVGNYCHAPVLVDVAAGVAHFQPSFCYIAHFSKFVRPGAKVVSLDNHTALGAIAFANPRHEIVFVVLNTSDGEQSFTLTVGADARACRVPAHAIQTHVVAT